MHQNNILRLDISMQNLIFMHDIDSLQQVSYDKRNSLFCQGLPGGYNIVKLAITA